VNLERGDLEHLSEEHAHELSEPCRCKEHQDLHDEKEQRGSITTSMSTLEARASHAHAEHLG
jgi:hypothetical protein